MLTSIGILSNSFFKSGNESIDIFLSRNNKLSLIGKQAILASILRSEMLAKFHENMKEPSHDWYQFLFNWITREQTEPSSFDFTNTEVSIITFNYDRSLEHYLYTSATHSFQELNQAAIIQELKKIKIHHVYGKAAPLDWENPAQHIAFRTSLENIDIRMFTDEIDVIYSERNKKVIQEAKSSIEQAENIFFLGFGFRDENMRLLDFPNIVKSGQRIFGTAFQSLPEEIERIISRYCGRAMQHPRIKPKIEDVDCRVLLRKYLD